MKRVSQTLLTACIFMVPLMGFNPDDLAPTYFSFCWHMSDHTYLNLTFFIGDDLVHWVRKRCWFTFLNVPFVIIDTFRNIGLFHRANTCAVCYKLLIRVLETIHYIRIKFIIFLYFIGVLLYLVTEFLEKYKTWQHSSGKKSKDLSLVASWTTDS